MEQVVNLLLHTYRPACYIRNLALPYNGILNRTLPPKKERSNL